jgi:hypothetical protein
MDTLFLLPYENIAKGVVMACFLVPAAEAIVTSIIKHHRSKATQTSETTVTTSSESLSSAPMRHQIAEAPASIWEKRLSWLTRMLWGGSGLLAIEHVWHGEVTYIPPFLTAMNNPADTQAMLHEMATNGVGMALFVTASWAAFVVASDKIPALRKLIQPSASVAHHTALTTTAKA